MCSLQDIQKQERPHTVWLGETQRVLNDVKKIEVKFQIHTSDEANFENNLNEGRTKVLLAFAVGELSNFGGEQFRLPTDK